MDEFYLSFDEDWSFSEGPFESHEEAVEAAKDIITRDKETGEWEDLNFDHSKPIEFFVGKKEAFDFQIDPESTIEAMQEQAYDLAGEAAEDWLDSVSKAESERLGVLLQNAVDQWLKEIGDTPPFGIYHIKSYWV